MSVIKKYLSLIKFSHTIFAMPFALIGFSLGVSRLKHNDLLVNTSYDFFINFPVDAFRNYAEREHLWGALRSAEIDLIATDHSPAPPSLKHVDDGDFIKAWGGIASLQLRLMAVWTGAEPRGISLVQLADWQVVMPQVHRRLEHLEAEEPYRLFLSYVSERLHATLRRDGTDGLAYASPQELIDDLYALLKRAQLERARAALAGEATDAPEVRFTLDLYTAFYGQREFGSAAVPWEFCLAEWNAQFLGDAAYRISDRERRNLRREAQHLAEPGVLGDALVHHVLARRARPRLDA